MVDLSGKDNTPKAIAEYEYKCGGHCKLCPFPGFKCHGRPTKLNYEETESPFAKLINDENSAH